MEHQNFSCIVQGNLNPEKMMSLVGLINAHISLQELTAIKRQDLNSVEHLENLKSIPVTHMILNVSIDFH